MKFSMMVLKFKIKRFINNIRGVKDLDNDGKIESVKEELQGVFQQFVVMRDAVDAGNMKLAEVMEDELRKQVYEQEALERLITETNLKLELSAKRVSRAEEEIHANNRIKEKVSEFIG